MVSAWPKVQSGIEIGVVVVAAVAGPETGVDIQIHQVGEASDSRAPVALLLGRVAN